MRASVLAVFGTAVVVLVSALAETRKPSPLHPDSLARLEAITAFCEKADSTDASQFVAKLTEVTAGHSEVEIENARQSFKYQHAMRQADSTLVRVLPEDAVRACTDFLSDN